MILKIPASIKHIAHKGDGLAGARGVDDVDEHRWERRGEKIRDNFTASRPCEDFNLSGCIHENIAKDKERGQKNTQGYHSWTRCS